MAQDLGAVKSNFAKGICDISDRLLALVRDCDEINASYFAKGFDGAGAASLVQADLVGFSAHLTPAIVASVITQIQAASAAITSGGRDVLRSAITTPLP